MMPVVFRIPGIEWDIPGYGLMMCIGFLASILWAARRASRSGADPDVILNCGFIAMIAGVVGCRAMYVIHYWDEQFAQYEGIAERIFAIVNISRGGVEFYGGFILATVCTLAYLWWRKHSLRWYMDIMAPSAALGLAIGRVGCLLNGCCFGATCDLPWAVQFPYGSPALQRQWQEKMPGADLPSELLLTVNESRGILPWKSLTATEEQVAAARRLVAVDKEFRAAQSDEEKKKLRAEDQELRRVLKPRCGMGACSAGAPEYLALGVNMTTHTLSLTELRDLADQYGSLPVHPTQVYSTITAGLIALLLNAFYWRRRWDGQVICLLFTIEPISRYAIELIRADNPHDTLGFTISQFLAITLTLAGITALVLIRRLPPRSPRAVIWEPPEEETPRKQGGKRKRARAAP